MNGKFTILVLTNDIVLVKNLQERTKSFLFEPMFVPLSSGEKLAEYAAKYGPDAVLVDDAFLDPMNGPLLAKLRTTLSAGGKINRPFFLLSVERPVADIKRTVENGFVDVFTKPVDTSLFFQKLQIHFPQKQFLKDRLLFSMDVNSSLDLALECKLIRASEYGATVRLNRDLQVGDLFTLHGKMFGALTGACLGRVVSSVPIQGGADKFEVALVFVAPGKEILSAVRLWMKQEYVRGREAGA